MGIAFRFGAYRIGVVALVCLLSGLLAPKASAVPVAPAAVPLGGGAPIGFGDVFCTLATIGRDNTGELVGFTAAHCGAVGDKALVVGYEGPVGRVVAVNSQLDYAVVKFNTAKVRPIANFGGFPINGLGPNPHLNQPACWMGAVSGHYCTFFTTFGIGRRGDLWQSALAGDDGGPVTCNGLLVGLITKAFDKLGGVHAPWPETHVLYFSTILADRNAIGGPGAGFNPIPA